MMDGGLLVTASWWMFVYLSIDIYIQVCECERGKLEVPFLNLSVLISDFFPSADFRYFSQETKSTTDQNILSSV